MFNNLKVHKVAAREEDNAGETHLVPHTSTTNILAIAVAGLGGFLFGYANNSISGTLAQTSFQAKFLTGSNANSIVDGILGGFLGGGLIGAVIQAPISRRYGRRAATGFAAIVLTVSAVLQAASYHIAMFIAFRIICGIGAGIVLTNVPVYMSEISPPHTRGMLVGSHAITIVYAYIFSSCMALGFHFIDRPYVWRLQFVMLTFVSILLLVSLPFIPESPRWLVEQERYEEAQKVLEKLHRGKNDTGAHLAKAEMVQIKAQVDAERSLPSGYIYIFKTPQLRKRAFCSILVWVMGQSTGILAIANLTPTLFGALGYSTVLQLGLSIVWTVCALIACFINAAIMDKVGRVKLLVIGGYLCSAALICEALLQKYYLGSENEAGLKAAVGMFFVFIIFYGATIDCAAYVYISEIWPTHLRSQGASIGLVSFFATSIAYNSPSSLAFATIGWKYYLVFVAVCITASTAILFYLPETAGLTLEEIGAEFGDHVEIQLRDIHFKEGKADEILEVEHVV
ncbi:general substrate transporter [Cadophora sp. DSE1049]|nr:general substrate transporter [Cadophora sp. DSE1049]